MTDEHTLASRDPYLMAEPPTSTGRLLLARAFEHYCAIHWGFSGVEIAAAFRGEGASSTIRSVRSAARLLGETIARGGIPAWARPFGGGPPADLKAGIWELDAFDSRFATSAIDPKRPYDGNAEPTSWIFVDRDAWNALVEASVADHVSPPRRRTFRIGPGAPVEESFKTAMDAGPERGAADRLIRLPEVKSRTGLSRSTIYRRMDEGRFPRKVEQSGNVASWRESDVDDWIAFST